MVFQFWWSASTAQWAMSQTEKKMTRSIGKYATSRG